MQIEITAETIITAAGVLAAITAMGGALITLYKRAKKPEENSKLIEELKAQHEDDMNRVKKENTLVCYALSACLDGLLQLGCNHTVPDAKKKLDKYLNQQAHE